MKRLVLNSKQYAEESKRLEETCCHSNFSEKPPVKTGMKIIMDVTVIPILVGKLEQAKNKHPTPKKKQKKKNNLHNKLG